MSAPKAADSASAQDAHTTPPALSPALSPLVHSRATSLRVCEERWKRQGEGRPAASQASGFFAFVVAAARTRRRRMRRRKRRAFVDAMFVERVALGVLLLWVWGLRVVYCAGEEYLLS
jgi:hypothetical protein